MDIILAVANGKTVRRVCLTAIMAQVHNQRVMVRRLDGVVLVIQRGGVGEVRGQNGGRGRRRVLVGVVIRR